MIDPTKVTQLKDGSPYRHIHTTSAGCIMGVYEMGGQEWPIVHIGRDGTAKRFDSPHWPTDDSRDLLVV